MALPATASHYTITDLGPLPWASGEAALSLNAAGQVGEWQEQGGVIHAARWDKGEVKDLGTPPGFISSITHGINSHGQSVGWAITSRNLVDSLATTHACLFDATGKAIDLGTLGGRDSQAFGINAGGQIVGGSLRADKNRHAFLYAAGKMTDLGTLPGGNFSLAYAISDAGTVVGISETTQSAVHACLWKHGKIIDLGTLPGGSLSLGFALNSRDAAAGSSVTHNEYHATLFTLGTVRDLGTLGSDPASLSSLDDQGRGVGASNLSPNVRHALLWEKGKMTDLNTLISPKSGWILLAAAAINKRGQIVGTARSSAGAFHAVLLTPLTP